MTDIFASKYHKPRPQGAGLSPMEKQTLDHMLKTGDGVKATGVALNRSPNTISTHLLRISQKLGYKGRCGMTMIHCIAIERETKSHAALTELVRLKRFKAARAPEGRWLETVDREKYELERLAAWERAMSLVDYHGI